MSTVISDIYDPIISQLSPAQIQSSTYPWNWEHIQQGKYGNNVMFKFNRKNRCIDFVIDPYGATTDVGLLFLADVATGGDGSYSGHQLSKLPDRMKRQLSTYIEQILDIVESFGFEILGPTKTTTYSDYATPVTTPEFDQLLEQVYGSI